MDRKMLRQVEKIEITVLVDNYSDVLLPDAPMVKRMRVAPPQAPMAEHGLACLVSACCGGECRTILMDSGISGSCLLHNAALLDISAASQRKEITHRLEHVEAVVLSHGHFDHFSGLPAYLRGLDRPMPLVVHPGAFVDRRVRLGSGPAQPMPAPDEKALGNGGAMIEKRGLPSTLADDCFLVTGEVARVTDFEKGAAYLEANIDGQWVMDPFHDDQGIAIDLKNKGLVVIGGCSHSGIVNMVKHAMKVAQSERLFAVLGGFHLTGADPALIYRTIEALIPLDPRVVVPMHCTGWKAIHAFAEAIPEAFVLNSVGTTFIFES